MANDANTRLLQRLWDLFEAREWEKAADLFHPGFVADWPHTRERFRGGNYVEVNRTYPEPWKIEIVRIFGAGDLVVSELAVGHPAGTSFCCAVMEVRDGKIVRATEYWADDDHEAPAWRAHLAERY